MPVLPGVAQAKPFGVSKPFFAYKYRDQLKVGRFYKEEDPKDEKKAKEIVKTKAKGIIKRRKEKEDIKKWLRGDGSFNPESLIETTVPQISREVKESEPVADVLAFPAVEEQPINSLLESKGNYFQRLSALKKSNPEEHARIIKENQAKAKATREKKAQKRVKVSKVKNVKQSPQNSAKEKLLEELKEKITVDKKIEKIMEEAKGKDLEVLLNELDEMANEKLEKNNKTMNDIEKILDARDKIKSKRKMKSEKDTVRELLPSKKPSPPPNKPRRKKTAKEIKEEKLANLAKARAAKAAKKGTKAKEAKKQLEKLIKNTESNLKGNVFEK